MEPEIHNIEYLTALYIIAGAIRITYLLFTLKIQSSEPNH